MIVRELDDERPNPFRSHARVVHALVLRDIKTRTGASYFGFLFGLIMPLGHIGIVLAVYVVLGRKPAVGTDVILFLGSAILPFIVWSYTHQKMIAAFGQNRALMSFPIVGLSEIAVARSIVELLSSALVVVFVSIFVVIAGIDLNFYSYSMLFLCLIVAFIFGIATGIAFGILSLLNEFLAIIGYLLIPLFWLSCGVFFIPDALPDAVRNYASLFALAHIVDFARTAIYPGYATQFPNFAFVLGAIGANLFFSLALARIMRSKLTNG